MKYKAGDKVKIINKTAGVWSLKTFTEKFPLTDLNNAIISGVSDFEMVYYINDSPFYEDDLIQCDAVIQFLYRKICSKKETS